MRLTIQDLGSLGELIAAIATLVYLAAQVRQKFSMNALKMGQSMSISGEEKFELVKTDEGWKFTKGMK